MVQTRDQVRAEESSSLFYFLFSIPGAHHLGIGTEYPQLDLAVLSLCDHLVIDFGTFGLWVSDRCLMTLMAEDYIMNVRAPS